VITLIAPAKAAGSATSQTATRTGRPSRSLGATELAVGFTATAGVSAAQAARQAASTATPENTGPGPSSTAAAPSTGPMRTPPIAAEIAPPISSPRLLSGAIWISQARPPAQERAPPTPWRKRVTSSTAASVA
jgi:hypothetical protein